MKTAIVTGATSGIGFESAIALATRHGMHVAIVARNREKGEATLQRMAARGAADVSLLTCDFGVLAQVRSVAHEVRERFAAVDVLVNNAGKVSDTRRVTVDGFEETFAVNHLAPYLLTRLLLDRVRAGGRIVNVASTAHYRGDVDFDNLQYERGGYFIMRAYRRSKLANVLFTLELARRAPHLLVNCLHPGVVATDIWDRAPWFAQPVLAVVKRVRMISVEEGGARLTYVAASPDIEGKTGGFYDNNTLRTPSAAARDESLARKLWDVSASMVGLAAIDA